MYVNSDLSSAFPSGGEDYLGVSLALPWSGTGTRTVRKLEISPELFVMFVKGWFCFRAPRGLFHTSLYSCSRHEHRRLSKQAKKRD